ncbi:MAG: VCBS repeat-containing protein [Terracidiphilus sp.]
MKVRFPFLCFVSITLALAAPSAWAQSGLRRALADAGKTQDLLGGSLGQKFVAADFDNDMRPDAAVLLEAGQIDGKQVFRIRLYVSSGTDRDLTFRSTETALAISALDVNQDGTPDLVVEQVFTHKRLQVWLNDGHGRFRQARVEDFPSLGESPRRLKAPAGESCGLVLALPTRTGNDQAALLLQVLRFDSSSSDWRARSGNRQAQSGSLAFHSPRSPPRS